MVMKKSLYDEIFQRVKDGESSCIEIGAWHKGIDVRIDGAYVDDDLESDIEEFAYDYAGDLFGYASQVSMDLYVKNEKLRTNISYTLTDTEPLYGYGLDKLHNAIFDVVNPYILKKLKKKGFNPDSIYLEFDGRNIKLSCYDDDDDEVEIRCYDYFIKDLDKSISNFMDKTFNFHNMKYYRNINYYIYIEQSSISMINFTWKEEGHTISCGC